MKKQITAGLERIAGRAVSAKLRRSAELEAIAVGVGRLQATLNAQTLRATDPLFMAEFKVFSQFGEDGIIQHLVHRLGIPREQHTFVEFGVENYMESNTRFLLLNNNWRGMVIDASAANMQHVRSLTLHWKYDLSATEAFINRDNINDLIRQAGVTGQIGLLSVDIDGNDYWVWESIDVVSPTIVIAEYNSVLGPERPITIRYDPGFVRSPASEKHLLYGASLAALCHLGDKKGYAFIGCNSAGNNAYFLRRDVLGEFRELTPREGYVESRFSEYADPKTGTRLRGAARLAAIRGLQVIDVVTGKEEPL